MRYIFCILALLVQPVFTWYVYHKQDKEKAALKMPMLYFSGIYLVIQIFVFWKFCIKIPDAYQKWSYLIQAALLAIFIVLELALLQSNKYINVVQTKEQNSIKDFKSLITELEICRVNVTDTEDLKVLDSLVEKMRYSDPVSSPETEQEIQKIHELIAALPKANDHKQFKQNCGAIAKQLEIRNIKNKKRG